LSRLIAVLAGLGLLMSFAGHVGLVLGHDLFGSAWPVLFVGIFVVWFPTVLAMRRFGPVMQRKDGWKVALTGAPEWVRYVVYAALAYAIINFGLGFLGLYSLQGSGFWRVGSSHAMAFYAAAWGLATASNRREELGIDWKCLHGHDMTPGARFCEVCGAPAQRSIQADA
jgi:hypothetical protein